MITREYAEMIWELKGLRKACRNDKRAFVTAGKHAKTARLRGVFKKLALQRDQFADDLELLIRRLGGNPKTVDDVESSSSAAWNGLKVALNAGRDYDLLAEFKRREDKTYDAYMKTLQRPLPPAAKELLRKHAGQVHKVSDHLRALRDTFQDNLEKKGKSSTKVDFGFAS